MLTGLGIYFSKSRSGAIALVLETLLLIFNERKQLKIGVFVCLIIMLLSLGLPFIEKGAIFENRSQIWLTAFTAGLEKPIFGWGFGNVTSALKQTSISLNNNVQYQFVDSSHNIFLDFWVQGGIFGLALLTGFFYKTVGNFLKRQKSSFLAAFLGIFIMFLFNPLSVVNLIELWWLFGQSYYII